ncbi:MAG: bifunctional ornithine acetyltransferase/N-acetylglutamate synthase [Rhizobiales bacterium TMED143]|nr:bifunctional ornithine acetyltransferase/N-acetylglutamate synthase [Rhodobiaceae bacterium]OUV92281.1 MAG: bifunctional ornithine acetyltransferase/N-acetylglutamate synthase [Rhizobiales bacterium TMED143]CAI8326258.1 MAG: Arginine biosynthesis bifunctional protein ArgJ [Rhodobiaceae bacterium UBA7378]HCQ81506.1 bifunctional ornithine acetyltransferase/N-acetylglutamate synthase [Rhodobiaceae bacterium]|tara:strand:- start:1705 stop:2970 length:1266 start_codon:yes stop_codon:yes gene_type:complete
MPDALPPSPFAPPTFPPLPEIEGMHIFAAETGARYTGRPDFMLAEFSEKARVAGVFTTSKMPSAPVDLSRLNLKSGGGRIRGLAVNAGNANAFTGAAGARAAMRTARSLAKRLSCSEQEIFIASTGVIGETLDPAPLVSAIKAASFDVAQASDWSGAAQAIITTDTFAKGATRTAKIGKQSVRINAVAKGSGMIAPDMATMLAFVFTDAAIPAHLLRAMLNEATHKSFNAITVDSDTSTSDTCLLVATGVKKVDGPALRRLDDPRLGQFRKALTDVMQDVAIQVVCDGEGVSKLMTIDIAGAVDDEAARRIGLTIGNSPLVKTAVAGEDANWGRIVMAVGKSGEMVDRDRLSIDIGGHKVARRGRVVPGYDETPVARHMQGQRIHIAVNVGAAGGKAQGRTRIWASDLTHGYISINADYRS